MSQNKLVISSSRMCSKSGPPKQAGAQGFSSLFLYHILLFLLFFLDTRICRSAFIPLQNWHILKLLLVSGASCYRPSSHNLKERVWDSGIYETLCIADLLEPELTLRPRDVHCHRKGIIFKSKLQGSKDGLGGICSNISVSNLLIQRTQNNRFIDFDFEGRICHIYRKIWNIHILFKSSNKGDTCISTTTLIK